MSIVERAISRLQQRAAEVARPAATSTPGSPGTETAVAAEFHDTRPGAAHPHLSVDLARLRETGLLPPDSEERRLASEFRRIKRPLVARAFGSDVESPAAAGVIMVASAVPGEGKTFTAVNLSLSLALERDVSVLLIDADVPKPQISAVFGIDGRLGLLDALGDERLDAEALIHETDLPNVAVMGTGTRTDVATELLASQQLGNLMSRLRRAAPRRIIVVDSPPLLLTTEASGLYAVAGQIVLVVRAGVTPQSAVLEAIRQLPEKASIGIVLNAVAAGAAGDGYYGYGRYGSYPAHGPATRTVGRNREQHEA